MNSDLKVTLLGTGAPRPTLQRSGPSQVVHVGDEMFLVDCGDGATTQLLRANINPGDIKKALFTHLHTDHTLGYGQFVLGGWTYGRRALSVWGPRGLARLTDTLFKDLYKEDIEYRTSLGRPASGLWDIRVSEIGPGKIIEGEKYTVTTTEVVHSIYTVAYRFDFAGQSLVISGDTGYCDNLVELARGADLLVQDACVADTDQYSSSAEERRLWENLRKHHTSASDAGRIAREAGVHKLVLTHFLPGADTTAMARDCAKEFDGEIIFGEDLMTVGSLGT